MKKTKLFIVAGLLFIAFSSVAQKYNNAVGLRFGFPSFIGFDFKHNFDQNWAIDAGLGFGKHYLDIDVQGLYHFPVPAAPGLRIYAGLAVDMGVTFHPDHYYYGYYYDGYYYDDSRLILGLSALGGVEYTFDAVPINLSLDLGPRLPISPWADHNGYYGLWFWRANFAVRYAF